ncbi:hypothetical protein HanOQP8_Chr02g0053231 [Helianthus annuus]|nr:hypothetical protein HanOQP8_Chr02g0053231 [Helianthus annuus]
MVGCVIIVVGVLIIIVQVCIIIVQVFIIRVRIINKKCLRRDQCTSSGAGQVIQGDNSHPEWPATQRL